MAGGTVAITEDGIVTVSRAQLIQAIGAAQQAAPGGKLDVDNTLAQLSFKLVVKDADGQQVGSDITFTGAPTAGFNFTPPANDDRGLTVEVTVSDGQSTSAMKSFAVDLTPVNDLPTGSITIDGAAVKGGVLDAVTESLADEDGLGTLSFQWQANGQDIVGATGSSLVLSPAQVGKAVTVVTNYVDGHGTLETVASAPLMVRDPTPLVDDAYYLARYADVAAAGVDPDEHYAQYGWHEGRDPNAFFSTSGYLSANADVRAAGINPLEHYLHFGAQEGRDPSISFDGQAYLARNADVVAAGVNPLEHFLSFGQAEGRAVTAAVGERIVGGFDAEYYLLANPDVAAAGMDPLTHYFQFGFHEQRDPNGFFDASAYLTLNPDVAAAGVDPVEHYLTFGWLEGRQTGGGLDAEAYLVANPDVRAAGMNPLEHYLVYGSHEGRIPEMSDAVL